MAKVTFGGGVSNIQGSIGGNCFTRNRAGVAIRNRVKPNNPATAKQMRQRNAFSRIAKHWKHVSEENRLSWDALAHESRTRGTCGNIIAMTGFAAYMQMNLNRFSVLLPVIDVPDDVQNAAFVGDFWGASADMLADETIPTLTIPLGDGAAENDLSVISLSGPIGPGQTRNFKSLQHEFYRELTAGDIAAGHVDFGGDTFFETFGAMTGTAGKKWVAGCRQYSKSIFAVPTMMTTIVIKS